tara:strand:+ start:1319 stop:4843 length:3525 start_codon:yes stop_codon:yes gene_type:complete
MADLKISALNSLAGADLVAADVVAVVDDSASETKKLTVSDLIANGVTIISDATIPSAKILFSAGAIDTAELAASAVETAKINDSAVTAAKLADNSSVTLVSTLPASGAFTGQIALDTDDDKIYIWDGSAWDSVKGAGSINVVNGSTTGEINIVASTSGDTVTISATLDNTTAAAQFLGGPTGAAGAVGYRALVGSDLPTPTTSTKGGVIVNGEGLRMDLDTIEIANDVTANSSTYQAVQFNSKGLITAGRDITAADLPEATAGAIGGVKPGSGLTMGSAGAINHSNAVTGATNTKITFDAQGHVTSGTSLSASDIPDLDTAKVTTGTFPTARIADDAVTADKLGDKSTATIAEITPTTGDFIGQLHLNSITRDLFLYDGNVWQPIGISVGEIVLAGTYNASTNLVATVTAEGTAVGYTVGAALPAASTSNKGHYVIVSEAGTGTSPAPTVALNPPDFLLSTGTAYTEIDVSDTVTAQQASNIGFSPAGGVASTNVQGAIEEVDTEKAPKASPTFTGTVALGEDAVMTFEGATSNDFETTLTVVDPTADRSLSLPNVSGTLVSSGDTGTVTSTMILDGTIANADISSSAEIAVSKLANGTARQLLQTDAAGTGVEFTSNVDVPGTLDVTGAATLDSTLGVAGVISADGKVKFPAGSASAPSFYSGTDTNTGLYFSAADEVSITTGGTQRVVVDSSGRVGIGSSSPYNILTGKTLSIGNGSDSSEITLLSGTAGSGALWFGDATSGAGSYIGSLEYSHNGDYMRFVTGGTERLRIDGSGRILIGTTNAVAFGSRQVLAVTNGTTGGVLSLYNSTTATANTRISSNPTGSEINDIGIHAASTNGSIQFYTNNDSERMRIDSSGRVGINTTSFADSATALVIKNSASGSEHTFLDIVCDTNESARVRFSEDGSTFPGEIRYNGLGHDLLFTVNSSERMRIDSSGQLLMGSSSSTFNVIANQYNAAALHLSGGGSGSANIQIHGANHSSAAKTITFSTSSTERMRIHSGGYVSINSTSTIGSGQVSWAYNGLSQNGLVLKNTYAGSASAVVFYSSTEALVGNIAVTTSSTSYNTSSDYRLKENVVDLSGAIDRVKQLAPKRFNFIVDADRTVDGFLAHEAQTVVPEAVTGAHNEVDDDDNPVYQGIDQAKLVPLLTAALKEAIAKIETLETKVAALEAE